VARRKKPNRRMTTASVQNKPLAGLEQSGVPGRITINLSGEIAKKVNDLASTQGSSKNSLVLSILEKSFEALPTTPVIQNREAVLRYSRVIINALQEAHDYDSLRQHNQPPPDLWIDDQAYLEELKNLIAELKRLNDLLEKPRPSSREAKRAVSALSKHFDTFLSNYAKGLGTGAAGLTIGTMAALLYQAGAGKDIIDAIWGHILK
jgi:hypothetical protein